MTTWPSAVRLSLDRKPSIAPYHSEFLTTRALPSISRGVSSTEAQSNPGCPSCSGSADFPGDETFPCIVLDDDLGDNS